MLRTSVLAVLLLVPVLDAQRCRATEEARFDADPYAATFQSLDLSGTYSAALATDASGASRVDFRRFDGVAWVPDGSLQPTPAPAWNVALDGDLAVAGMPYESSVATNLGAVATYSRASGSWVQEGVLYDPVGIEWDSFGSAVAISGDVLVVGSQFGDAPAFDGGKATVFRRAGGAWTYEATLGSLDVGSYDGFASSVATDGAVVVCGGINYSAHRGAAWVFRHDGVGWVEEQRLDPDLPDPFLEFGTDVDVDGDVLVVGVPFHPANPPQAGHGAARVFRFAGTWVRSTLLEAEVPVWSARLGSSVAVDGHVIAVGGPALGGGVHMGTANLFVRTGLDDWTEWVDLAPTDPIPNDWFGGTVALDLPWLWVAAPASRNAVYAFRTDAGVPGLCSCNGAGTNPEVLSSAGPPVLGATWSAQVDTSAFPAVAFTALLAHGAPLVGVGTAFGELLVDPTSPPVFASLVAPVAGVATHLVTVPADAALTGFACFAQAGLLDGTTPTLTNSLTLVAGP